MAWETTGTLIETNDTGSARTPDVAMDPRGDVTVVWSQQGPPYSIWANHYDARTGLWETAQLIENDDAGDALAPRVAMNGGGAAIVVWRQTEGSTSQAWIDRFAPEAGWGAAEPVHIFGQPAFIVGGDLAVDIDSQGNAMVLVLYDDFELQAVPHLAASGWAEAESLQRGPIEGFAIALAPAGSALATWLLSNDDHSQLHDAQVEMDPRGHAHAIWLVFGAPGTLMTARRVAPGGFGEPTLHAGIQDARLAANAQGKAVVIRVVPTTCPETGQPRNWSRCREELC